MPDFLIHRDGEGQIMRAVPYGLIMYMDIDADTYNPETDTGGAWRIEYMMQGHMGYSIYTDQATAERYLSEWREWWEKQDHPLCRLPETVTNLCVPDGGGR